MKTTLFFLIAICSFQLLHAQSRTADGAAGRQAGLCAPTTAQADLDINNVRARILVGGDLWWDPVGQQPHYEVPAGSGLHSIFAGALWIAGLDNTGQVIAAAQTYRQNGANDFFAGPVSENAGVLDVTPATCSAYDRIWKITRQQVADFVNGQPGTNDILTWPGNGNVAAGELPFLAPFVDIDNDGLYIPANGDYPAYNLSGNSSPGCNDLKGHQTLWWVFNDVGGPHTETTSDPIGLEIRAQAFAFSSPVNHLNNATFYEYQIINRSNMTLSQSYAGMWCDAEVGSASDDYVGCDVGRGLGYAYNSSSTDFLYGTTPPAVGIDFIRGPLADVGDGIDNNRDGIIDEPDEEIIMSKFVYYENVNNIPNGNPFNLDDYYQYLSGIWLDGLPITYGGDGRNQASPTASFMFPNNSDPAFTTPWTMDIAGIQPNDMRFIQSAGSFTMEAGEVNTITTAVVWARTNTPGSNAHLASLALLLEADSLIQALFDNCFVTGVEEVESEEYNIYPNPFSDETTITFNAAGRSVELTIYDSSGKLVYRASNASGKYTISKRDLSSGVYIFRLEGINVSGKLVVL